MGSGCFQDWFGMSLGCNWDVFGTCFGGWFEMGLDVSESARDEFGLILI
jgi:hypothetical protein